MRFIQTMQLAISQLKDVFLVLVAPAQTGWNISVWNVNSTTMSVRWSPYNSSKTQNSSNLYGFAVACIPVRSNSTPTISSADVSSLTQEVVGLRPFTEYRVRVIAIVKDNSTGMVVMRTSETVLVNTTKDGNHNFPKFPKEKV